MSRNNRAQRGYTLAEVLSVVFIMGLVMSAVALVIGPLLSSQSQTQAKVDTVQAAAMALYRIERDLRRTDTAQIFECTTGGSATCAAPGTTLTNTNAIVVGTAYSNGTGPFSFTTSTGLPNWQGAAVYWVDSNNNLNFQFNTPAGFTNAGLTSGTAAQAVINVTTGSGGMQLARFVTQMSIATPAQHQVSFSMKTQSTVGAASNSTIYTTDTETRN